MYKKKRHILHKQLYGTLLFSLIAGYTGYTQSMLKGKVLDANGNPVLYANVLLLKPEDSALVKGIITEQGGTYLFKNIPKGKYIITITHTGFNQQYFSPVIVPENSNVEVKAIELSQKAVQLSAVTVQTKKPLFLNRK